MNFPSRLPLAAFLIVLTAEVVVAGGLTEVTAEAGVRFWQESGPEIPIGGGAAWADLDGDGDDDLLAAQATGCNLLFVNQGDGSFAPAPNAAGAGDCESISHGMAPADFDNDGDQDLFVTNYGANHLFKNLRAETGVTVFEDVTIAAGMAGGPSVNSASASWGDYNGDGFLDLVVANHLLELPYRDGLCEPDVVWLNHGDGTFEDVGPALGVAESGEVGRAGCGLASTWSDYDLDGDADLIVVNDFGLVNVPNRLFRNDGPDGAGGWIMTDVSRASGFDFTMFGMGVGIGDVDQDGDFDYYLSDIGDNNMARNDGAGAFADVAEAAGILANDRQTYGASGLVSWGSAFLDLDSDGVLELLVANGGAPPDKWPDMFGPEYIVDNPVYGYRRRPVGPYREMHVRMGLAEETYYRSVAVSDYDLDGDLDLFVGNLHGYGSLYRNDVAPKGNWLQVEAVGVVSSRDAIGARVEVVAGGVKQIREIDGGSGFLTRHSLVVHFGLGVEVVAEQVMVVFPSGRVAVLEDVAAEQRITVVEPE